MKLLGLTAAAALLAGSAAAAPYVVPGTSDPFLAGAPDGATVGWFSNPANTDTAPAESPVGVTIKPGGTVWISGVSGEVSNCGGCTFSSALGAGPISSSPFTATGFTPVVSAFTNLPLNSLVGVWYDATPGGAGVDEVFEIGDGGVFVAPAGATELYLATVDGYQWNNNPGFFNVSVSAAPEPAAWALMLFGVGGLGMALRTARRSAAAAV
jgi:hypothetical protein